MGKRVSVAAPGIPVSIPADRNDPDALFRRGAWYLLAICLFGLAIGLALLFVDGEFFRVRLYGTLMTVSMYRDQDTVWLAVCVAFSLYLRWLSRQRAGAPPPTPLAAFWPDEPNVARWTAAIAALVLLGTGLGTYVVHHAHDLIVDEYMPEFQSGIFLSGDWLASYGREWDGMIKALFPQFIYANTEHNVWGSNYRPVHAAIRAAFDLVSLGPLTNAILTTASIVLIVAVARRLWPDRRDAAILAAVLLATGPQFLINGMAGLSWPAHLCLNLLWLWLFLRDDALGHALAALVGCAAIGLHQVNVHPMFVMPFMIALLFSRRWWLAGFYAVVYATAIFTWLNWLDIAVALSAGPQLPEVLPGAAPRNVGGLLAELQLGRLFYEPLMVFNGLRLLAWQHVLLLPLIFVALRPWSTVPPTIRLLAWGCVFMMIPYVLIMPNQFHAWGYRYAHGLLGSFALIAVHGWVVLSANKGATVAAAKHAIIGFAALLVAVGIPLRALQTEAFVRPYADANRYIHALETEVVLVDAARVWFSNDVIRNDPYLTGQPVVLSYLYLTPEQLRQVCGRYSVTVIDHDDLARFDIPMVDRDYMFTEHDQTLRAIANGPECQES